MFINYIRLEKYKRFPRLGSTVFEKHFTNNITKVEGTNGAGKSRLLSRLSPLPADSKEFHESGMEEVHITHQNKQYVVISSFAEKRPQYYFSVDGGENLNRSGNITTQRELVYQHFGITQDFFNILTGEESFTDMSFGARKKFFSNSTKLDIDHVLKGHGKLNDERNLQRHILKAEESQYKIEEGRLRTDEEIKLLRSERDEVNRTIDTLLETRGHISRYFNPESNEGSYVDLQTLLKQRNDILRNESVLLTAYPRDTISSEISRLDGEVISYEHQCESILKELAQIEELRASLVHTTEGSISPHERRNVILDRLNLLDKITNDKLKDVKGVFDVSLLERHFFRLYDIIIPTVSEMKSNYDELTGEPIFGRAQLERAKNSYAELSKELHGLEALQKNYQDRSHLLSKLDEKVTCPCCNESWEIKNIVTTKEMDEGLVFINERRFVIEAAMKPLLEYANESSAYFANYSTVMDLKESTASTMKFFWDTIDNGNMLLRNPGGVSSLLYEISIELEYLKEMESLKNELKGVNETIKIIENTQGVSEEGLTFRTTELESLYHSLCNKISKSKEDLTLHHARLDTFAFLDSLQCSIQNAKDRVREFNLSTYTSNVFNILDNQIRELRIRVVELENIISEHNNVEYALKARMVTIEKTKQEIKVLTLLLDELSPKDGFIAKTISSFLNTIIENINITLEKIWSYKMVLEPIDVATESLNYRFKIIVDDVSETDDISLASRGMKEAINLAFKLVVYKLLDLQDFPMYSDELASNMDIIHTENMGRLIHRFATEGNFSQMFIVSHKESMDFLRDMDRIQLS